MSKKGSPIKVIGKATDLIETLSAQGAMTPAKLAESTDLPRSSAYRLLDGLAAVGLVDQLADGRVRLAPRWLSLADAAQEGMTEWSGAGALLEQLVRETAQTAYLTILIDDEAVCVDWRRGRGVDVMALKPGRSLPLHTGAAGRVLLAYGVDLDHYLEDPSRLTPRTPNTLVTPASLRKDVALTRSRGYALSEQDATIGINAIGVPVLHDGELIACLSLGGLTRLFGTDPERFLPALQAASDALSRSYASQT